MERPHYVTMTKDRSFFHSDIMIDIDLPPSDGLKKSSILPVPQPIEIGSFSNLSHPDPPHRNPPN